MDNQAPASKNDIIQIILAVILPPIGVFMKFGVSGALILNILLTCLGFLPGVVHALYVLYKK